MTLKHKLIIALGALAWFLVFWYLPEYHDYAHRTSVMLKAIGVAGAVAIAFILLTGGATDKYYTEDQDEDEKTEKEKQK